MLHEVDCAHFDNCDRILGHILVTSAVAGRQRRDLVDHIHASRYLGKHGVAIVCTAMIQERVVEKIDEELRGCAVHFAGSRHGQAKIESATDATNSDKKHGCRFYLCLAIFTDLRQRNMPRRTSEFLVAV